VGWRPFQHPSFAGIYQFFAVGHYPAARNEPSASAGGFAAMAIYNVMRFLKLQGITSQ